MLETPQIIRTAPQAAAIIHLTIPQEQIRNVMGPGLSELKAVLAAQGIAPAGPWFTHHLRVDPDVFDFEIALPVAATVTPAGRVQSREWPAMNVARTVYHGGFEGLGEAWEEFIEWIEGQGHNATDELWERYLVGSEQSGDSADWRTELSRPLVAN